MNTSDENPNKEEGVEESTEPTAGSDASIDQNNAIDESKAVPEPEQPVIDSASQPEPATAESAATDSAETLSETIDVESSDGLDDLDDKDLDGEYEEDEFEGDADPIEDVSDETEEEDEKSEEEVKDGMDISLCAIDQLNKKITYSGAKRPLYFIPKEVRSLNGAAQNMRIHENNKGDKLVEFKGSTSSIGSNDFAIEEFSFSYESGDNLYLFSDGYVSQFGGVDSKKFNSKNLRHLLLSIQDLVIEQQGYEMKNSFELWKGEEEQTDDVTIIGITL